MKRPTKNYFNQEEIWQEIEKEQLWEDGRVWNFFRPSGRTKTKMYQKQKQNNYVVTQENK